MERQGSGGARRRRVGVAAAAIVAGVLLLAWASPHGAEQPAAPAAAPAAPTSHVVLTARPLAALALIGSRDVVVVSVPVSALTGGLVADPAAAVGRRVVVAVPAGVPLEPSLLMGPGVGVTPSHRVVRLSVDSRHVAPGVEAGDTVEVVMATVEQGGQRVAVAAVARVVAVEAGGSAPPSPAAGGGLGVGTADQPAVSLTLDCEAGAALRIVWAESFARSVEVMVEPDGAPPPPGASG